MNEIQKKGKIACKRKIQKRNKHITLQVCENQLM